MLQAGGAGACQAEEAGADGELQKESSGGEEVRLRHNHITGQGTCNG